MTSQPSPTYNFPGISYNPSYFNSKTTSTGLTTATANNLYLRKTYADTATSLETFSGGVATSSIDSLTASTNMTIGTNIYNGNTLTLGTTASKLVIPGPIQQLYCSSIDAISTNLNMLIGSGVATALVLGSATCTTSAKNFVASTGLTSYGSINISGIYDLNLTTGTVFTPKIDATGSLTVGGNASTTSLLLGSSTCPTTIQGNLIVSGTETENGTNIFTPSIDTASAVTMSIGNTNATTLNIGVTAGNTINIGKIGGTTTVNTALTSTGLITANSGLSVTGINMSYTTLPTFGTTQLGYIVTGNSVASGLNVSSGTTTQLASIPLTIGVWIITAQPYASATSVSFSGYTALRFNLSTAVSYVTTIGNLEYNSEAWASPAQSLPSSVITAIVKLTASTTYYLNISTSTIGGSIATGTSSMYAVRIA